MLVSIPVLIYLPRMHKQKDMLSTAALKLKSNQQDISKATRSVVIAVHKLVWEKRHYVLMLIRKLTAIPADVELMSVACHMMTCEFRVGSGQARELIRAFANNQLRDLKQGGCPLCYRAKIDVKLS
jgi:hypothetical protein